MSTTTTTTITVEGVTQPQKREFVPVEQIQEQWYKDLVENGFCVVKGAVPKERAEKCVDDMYSYLEGHNLGYDRNDTSTIHKDKLPVINEKGMCMSYGVPHEKFVWDIRSEPGVIGAFEKVYQTEDLIVSFDAVNFGFPNRTDLPPNKPWAHQDQDPTKPGFRCLQGYELTSPFCNFFTADASSSQSRQSASQRSQ